MPPNKVPQAEACWTMLLLYWPARWSLEQPTPRLLPGGVCILVALVTWCPQDRGNLWDWYGLKEYVWQRTHLEVGLWNCFQANWIVLDSVTWWKKGLIICSHPLSPIPKIGDLRTPTSCEISGSSSRKYNRDCHIVLSEHQHFSIPIIPNLWFPWYHSRTIHFVGSQQSMYLKNKLDHLTFQIFNDTHTHTPCWGKFGSTWQSNGGAIVCLVSSTPTPRTWQYRPRDRGSDFSFSALAKRLPGGHGQGLEGCDVLSWKKETYCCVTVVPCSTQIQLGEVGCGCSSLVKAWGDMTFNSYRL